MPREGPAQELADADTKRILVVEDDDTTQDYLSTVCGNEGFKTETACDGNAALRKIAAAPPDLVLLDLVLPSKGGYELARDLQAEGLGNVPLLIVSARYLDSKEIERFKQEPNVRGYLQKPLKPQVLAAAIHKLLKTQRAPKLR